LVLVCAQSIGDEFHVLLTCINNTIVEKYMPKYYWSPVTLYKMEGLFSIYNSQLLVKNSIFAKFFLKKINLLQTATGLDKKLSQLMDCYSLMLSHLPVSIDCF
jgi:hypothetical protein